ncbi:ScbA/BarX family gamma-butyrolactone biosynthesis protein [Dactylosporangium matsuzakiense]|uniref:Adhesin n=1 Tax=Dactylosporangium matsuzakiense TaxID=53360 RepID=A0A9W6KE31_9ACTN|nr:ScbA/BarX family gamma-butyrolactone biosynthesis protein [Dactylosporangium matsuzakiense]GLK99196.1 adhesin [Dactylosporangium matsuzakiense]
MTTETVAAPAEITFDSTVPRALVDRGDPTTVLITSWVKTPTSITAGAVWPRLGGYYTLLDHRRHDPMLVLETFRQCALLLAHVVDDVPLATMQILRAAHYTADPEGLHVTDRPTEVVVTIDSGRTEPMGHAILQTSMDCRLLRDGHLIATGGGRVIVPPNDRYLKVRGRDPEDVKMPAAAPEATVAPASVGRALRRDVVIAPGPHPGTYRLHIDAAHANFFDNPTDHTPGMLLTEAMRQAVVAESADPYFAPMGLAVRFHRFVELDQPGEVVVRRTAQGFHTEVRQDGKLAAHADWPVTGRTDG